MRRVLVRSIVALACALLATPLAGVTPAHAVDTFAVTAPAENAVWYTGETKTITWTVASETGAYTLELWGASARIATIGSGTDITAGTHRWTIPRTIETLIAEDVTVKLVPAAGSAVSSASFDLRRSVVHGVYSCPTQFIHQHSHVFCLDGGVPIRRLEAGLSQFVLWTRSGDLGGPVKVELIRTIDGKTTATVVAKSLYDDGVETLIIPAKTKPDTGEAMTYQWRVTPLAGGPSATSLSFAVIANSTSVHVGEPFIPEEEPTYTAGEGVGLSWGSPWREELGGVTFKVEAKASGGKVIPIYTGGYGIGPEFEWRPPAAGTYTITATNLTSKLKGTATLVAVAPPAQVVRQSAPSDATATIGQPITISWDFFDGPSDETANDSYLPVDVSLVASTGKVTKLYTAYSGAWDEPEEFEFERQFTYGEAIWRPAASIAPGTYTLKVNATGSTVTSDQSITIAAPSALTTDDLSNSSAEPGEVVELSWNVTDDAELPVDISLVPSGGKAIVVAKKLVAPGNTTSVTVPAGTAAGSYALTVTTVDKFGTSKTALTANEALTVTAPSVTVTASSTVALGGDLTVEWDYADDSRLPVKLELFVDGATKAAATISKSAPTASPGEGSLVWAVPAKLAAGTGYVVKATPIGPKSAATASSSAVALVAPTMAVSETPMSGGVTVGQTVRLQWTAGTGVDQTTTVSLLKGTKVVAKLDAKALTVNGGGLFVWLVGAKLVPGSDYSIRVTDNANKAITDDSSTFAILANQTTAG